MKASNDRLVELRENVHRLQVLSISNQDKYDKEMKRIDQNLIRKTMDLDNHLLELSQRIRGIEDELNEDEMDNSSAEKRSTLRHSQSILKKANQTGFDTIGEDDHVIIDEEIE